jgi:predicted nucleic acid-binding protein
MDAALIDTDILSEVLKARDARVLDRARLYLHEHARFAFSAITFYEMMRGFRAAQATRQLSNFVTLAASSDILPVSLAVLDRAASLWADARAGGHPQDDADLIIAASALESGRMLVTGNISHFNWISALKIDDWRQP